MFLSKFLHWLLVLSVILRESEISFMFFATGLGSTASGWGCRIRPRGCYGFRFPSQLVLVGVSYWLQKVLPSEGSCIGAFILSRPSDRSM